MAKFSFFFLLLTLFVYKDFKISQYHVVYALCTESSNNKISHCHISKTLKQASSLIICSLYLQIPVSGLTTPRSLSCLSTPPPLSLKLFWVSHLPPWVLPAPMREILRLFQRSEEWPRPQHRWEDVSTCRCDHTTPTAAVSSWYHHVLLCSAMQGCCEGRKGG